jgi:hypothetical protein
MCESQHLLVADFQLQSSQAELLTSIFAGARWLAGSPALPGQARGDLLEMRRPSARISEPVAALQPTARMAQARRSGCIFHKGIAAR